MRLKVNDLVMVIRPMPCGHASFGYPWSVSRIVKLGDSRSAHCYRCKEPFQLPSGTKLVYGHPDGLPRDAQRLIRIDPPSTDETTETTAELTA